MRRRYMRLIRTTLDRYPIRMPWQTMRGPSGEQTESLPGIRGRYVRWLEPPHVEGQGHYVHFSWKEDSFCLRDYIQQIERREDGGFTAQDIWKAASDHVPARGELYVPVEDSEFWAAKLSDLTENYKRGTTIARDVVQPLSSRDFEADVCDKPEGQSASGFKKPSLWSRLSSKWGCPLG